MFLDQFFAADSMASIVFAKTRKFAQNLQICAETAKFDSLSNLDEISDGGTVFRRGFNGVARFCQNQQICAETANLHRIR